MKLGILFSGGKDSYLAMHLASEEHEISCLLTIKSSNQDSWMFHTPAITWTKLQAESLDIPQVIQETAGIQGDELNDLFTLEPENPAFKAVFNKSELENIKFNIYIKTICDGNKLV